MRREAAVPIDEELEAGIRAQQQRVAGRWPGRHPHLFPALKSNAGGQHPVTYYSYRGMLNRWLDICDVRDEHGGPVHLTPHQWRHTFACRLINRDVPQEVVRVLLDHPHTQMTAHYAKITDQTVRRRWEQATRVNINGERGHHRPGRAARPGPVGEDQVRHRHPDAAQRLLRPAGPAPVPARQRLPDLPGLHHRTRVPARTARAAAAHPHPDHHRQGQRPARVTEMNEQVAANLDRMISELETITETHRRRPPVRADNSGHIIAAARRRADDARPKAAAALRRMDASGQPVTFSTVAASCRRLPLLALRPGRPARADRTTPHPAAAGTRPPRRSPTGSARHPPRCCAAWKQPPPASAPWKQTTANCATLSSTLSAKRARRSDPHASRDTPGKHAKKEPAPTLHAAAGSP